MCITHEWFRNNAFIDFKIFRKIRNPQYNANHNDWVSEMLDRNMFLVVCLMICKTTQFLIIMADMVQKYMLQAIDKNNKSQSSNIKCGERQQK